jgi:CheY-like chemotaxis protein
MKKMFWIILGVVFLAVFYLSIFAMCHVSGQVSRHEESMRFRRIKTGEIEKISNDCSSAPVLGETLNRSGDGLKRPFLNLPMLTKAKKECHILLVENNIIEQKFILSFLEKLGYQANAVTRKKEATKELEKTPYDLVLINVEIPEKEGWEVTTIFGDNQSKFGNNDVPVIAMYDGPMTADRKHLIDLDMNVYISKPIQAQKLFEVIKPFLPEANSDVNSE